MKVLLALLLLLPLAACETPGGDAQGREPLSRPSAPSVNKGAPQQLDTETPTKERYMRLGKKAEKEGKAELAAVLYRAASLAETTDPAPRAANAALLEKAREYSMAAAVFDQLAKETDGVPYMLAAARNHLKAGNLMNARANYENVIVKEPSNWRGYNGLAVTHDLNGNHVAAADNYEIAYDKASKESQDQILANWALSLLLDSRAGEAVEKLESSANSETNPRLKTRLGLAYALAGRPEDAKRMGLNRIPTPADLQRELRGATPSIDQGDTISAPVKP